MTATRRTASHHQQEPHSPSTGSQDSSQGGSAEEAGPSYAAPAASPSRRKRQAAIKEEEPQMPEVESTPSASSQRPKRNVRKSVLLSADYEVSMPGSAVKIEEPDEYDMLNQQFDHEETVPTTIATTTRPHHRVQTSADSSMVEEDIDVEMMSDPPGLMQQMYGTPVKRMRRTHVPELRTVNVEPSMSLDDEVADDEQEDEEEEERGPRTYRLESDADEYDELVEDMDGPPLLLPSASKKRNRGRPRKYPGPARHIRATNEVSAVAVNLNRARSRHLADKPITKTEAERINSYNVKLFESEVGETPLGDRYATVVPGCLSYILRKEKVVEMLTDATEIASLREQGWVSERIPALPPLVSEKACFAFYIDGTNIKSHREVSADDLRPWSTSGTSSENHEGLPLIKPNVRKFGVFFHEGRYQIIKGDARKANVQLVEYTAWLPRLVRLRKKVFYMTRDHRILGNILILYDYTQPGPVPMVLHAPHGNSSVAKEFNLTLMEQDYDNMKMDEDEDPFEEQQVMGSMGGNFLKVKMSHMNWLSNKRLLLKYLLNETSYPADAGWMNERVPIMPPLVEYRATYVYFVPASRSANTLSHFGDGLSPWNTGSSIYKTRSVRRALVQDSSGVFSISREDWLKTGMGLVETISILARCPRLRKRVIFIQKPNLNVLGNVAFVYEYINDGPVPVPVKLNYKIANIHGSLGAEDFPKTPKTQEGEEIIDVDGEVDAANDYQRDRSGMDDTGVTMEPPDTMEDGWDNEYPLQDEFLEDDSNLPYYEGVRHLSTGHSYLTVRSKRLAGMAETALHYIVNTSIVLDKGLLNESKPSHPPMVKNARAYSFFVAAQSIVTADINRDDFSPWSANATEQNPTSYRTKVRKFGLILNPETNLFELTDRDWRRCEYHMVHLYSLHPKVIRLRKKIFYVLNTGSKTVISHALIMYEYSAEGEIPRIGLGHRKRYNPLHKKRELKYENETQDYEQESEMHGAMSTAVLDDVSDMSESERDSPFIIESGVQQLENGSLYLQLNELEFMSDKNRQLHYLYNKPDILMNLDCINNTIPTLPPLTDEAGIFVFFVDAKQIDIKNLTCDALQPWSENMTMMDGTIMCRRPRLLRVPLAMNKLGQLRCVKKGKLENSHYIMHEYMATLPRLQRLRKKVVHVTKDGLPIGSAMIIYWYTERGEIPAIVNSIATVQPFFKLPPSLKNEAKNLLTRMTPLNAARALSIKANTQIPTRTMFDIRQEMRSEVLNRDARAQLDDDLEEDGNGWKKKDELPEKIVEDDSMDVAHTEEIIGGDGPSRSKSTPTVSMKNTSRQDAAIFRFARKHYNTLSDDQTFDELWKMLWAMDEVRLLSNIKHDFGVTIMKYGKTNEFVIGEDIDDDEEMNMKMMHHSHDLDLSSPNRGEIDVEVFEEDIDLVGEEIILEDAMNIGAEEHL